MSKTLYDSKGNDVVLCTNDDFDVITLFSGEYYGEKLLNIGISIDNFSHLILTTEGVNPNVLVAHIIPTNLMLTTNPYKVDLGYTCFLYLYKNNPNNIWVGNLSSITSSYINKVYGVKRP